jgi:hypothetical protein
MISTTQCKTNAAECQHLAMIFDISERRATALLAMSRSWAVLAGQTERYDAIRKEEGPFAASYGRPTELSVSPEGAEA